MKKRIADSQAKGDSAEARFRDAAIGFGFDVSDSTAHENRMEKFDFIIETPLSELGFGSHFTVDVKASKSHGMFYFETVGVSGGVGWGAAETLDVLAIESARHQGTFLLVRRDELHEACVSSFGPYDKDTVSRRTGSHPHFQWSGRSGNNRYGTEQHDVFATIPDILGFVQENNLRFKLIS